MGIEEDLKDRVFDPLFTTKQNGTGMGLAITYQLVERNGGTIEVESEKGFGSSFVVKFPLQRKNGLVMVGE